MATPPQDRLAEALESSRRTRQDARELRRQARVVRAFSRRVRGIRDTVLEETGGLVRALRSLLARH